MVPTLQDRIIVSFSRNHISNFLPIMADGSKPKVVLLSQFGVKKYTYQTIRKQIQWRQVREKWSNHWLSR